MLGRFVVVVGCFRFEFDGERVLSHRAMHENKNYMLVMGYCIADEASVGGIIRRLLSIPSFFLTSPSFALLYPSSVDILIHRSILILPLLYSLPSALSCSPSHPLSLHLLLCDADDNCTFFYTITDL